ncbi:Asp-tRNA(Asn)/Glu-tRNA(Gln) amidotransferase subunit GatC [bacterium]|nr:Asp-tRNA(Asn)/Glu-tRNA(Gln) amidotransferase subunit GatC [bacterium]
MAISEKEVRKVEHLAKLQFSPEEMAKLAQQLDQIVAYVEKLDELDTEGVQLTTHIVEIKNVFREDKSRQWLTQEQALANAPQKKNGYFSVPKVIEDR